MIFLGVELRPPLISSTTAFTELDFTDWIQDRDKK